MNKVKGLQLLADSLLLGLDDPLDDLGFLNQECSQDANEE